MEHKLVDYTNKLIQVKKNDFRNNCFHLNFVDKAINKGKMRHKTYKVRLG